MAKLPDIMRTVAIEHKGEKIQLEIHVHLSQEEIERIVAPAVLKSLSKQIHRQTLVGQIEQELGKRFRESVHDLPRSSGGAM